MRSITDSTAITPSCRRQTAIVPAWAKAIRFVANGIDGWPPAIPDQLSVPEFLSSFAELQHRTGAGEWDVLVYAIDHPEVASRVVRPYGRDNPYRRLCSAPGRRVKRIAHWSYMRWVYFDVVLEHAPC